MITFKEFIKEGVNDNFLYHNTGWLELLKIVEDGQLAGKRISFSRSKRYNIAPGAYRPPEARFIFDRGSLLAKRKIKPHADLFVADPSGWRDDKTIKGASSRWESEERVNGPIPITKQFGLVSIEVLKNAVDKHVNKPIELRQKEIKFAKEQKLIKIKEGLFWNRLKNEWVPVETDRQRKFHNLEGITHSIKSMEKEIAEYEKILKHPLLKIVDLFQ